MIRRKHLLFILTIDFSRYRLSLNFIFQLLPSNQNLICFMLRDFKNEKLAVNVWIIKLFFFIYLISIKILVDKRLKNTPFTNLPLN
jgi:hypothetical protein